MLLTGNEIFNKVPHKTRHLRCMVSPPIIITKCTDGKYGNYDFTIIILWNNHYNLNFNVGLSDDSKKWRWETWLSILSCIVCKYLAQEQYPKRELTTITVGMTADSAVMPTVIVVLSLISSTSWAPALIVIVYNLFRRKKKGHKWPKLKIFSAPKAENMKKMAQICCL